MKSFCVAGATEAVSTLAGPPVNQSIGLASYANPAFSKAENPADSVDGTKTEMVLIAALSGTEPGGFNQAHLIAAGGEFPTLIALDDHTTS